MTRKLLIPLLSVFTLASCAKERVGGTIPEISNLAQSAFTIHTFPGSEDSLSFRFMFKDGDADVVDGRAKVVFKNVLDTAVKEIEYPFPEVATDFDPSQGASGQVILDLDATSLLFQISDTARKRDTQRYEVYMADGAGHKSNVLTSQDVEVISQP